MAYQDIIVKTENEITTITLNRPDVLNSLSPNLVVELNDAVQSIAKDDTVRVLVLKGAGRAFSAGVDLKEMNASIQGGKFTQDEILMTGRKMIDTLQTMPQVTIAQVHGFCYTGSLELMLTFDLVYAAEDTKIGDTHAKWGILPKWGMTQRLPQKVGILKAHEMSFTAQTVSGTEAERIGLVNQALPLEELETKVLSVAEAIKANSPQTIHAIKTLYHQGQHTTLKEGLQIEADYDVDITDSLEKLRSFAK